MTTRGADTMAEMAELLYAKYGEAMVDGWAAEIAYARDHDEGVVLACAKGGRDPDGGPGLRWEFRWPDGDTSFPVYEFPTAEAARAGGAA